MEEKCCHNKDCEKCYKESGHFFICPDQEFVDDVEESIYDEQGDKER